VGNSPGHGHGDRTNLSEQEKTSVEPKVKAPEQAPPSGRWRLFRLIKRVLLLLVLVLITLIGTGLIYIQTEGFWRSHGLRYALGPRYDETLKIDRLDFGLFPPTLEMLGVRLNDVIPEASGSPPVISVDRVHAALSMSSITGRVEVTSLETAGLVINIRKDSKDRNTLTEALEALARDKRVATNTAPPAPGERVLPSLILRSINIADLDFKFRNDMIENGLEFRYQADAPLAFSTNPNDDFAQFVTPSAPGKIDDLLRVFTRGKMSLRGLGVEFEHAAHGTFDVVGLRQFPANAMIARVAMTEDGRELINAAAEIPLARAVTRPKALPFERLQLSIPTVQGDVALQVDELSFDPLSGSLDGHVTTDAQLQDFVDSYMALFAPGKRDEIMGQLDTFVERGGFVRERTRVVTDLHIKGRGLGAYAAERPGEAPPFRVETDLKVTVTDIPVGALGGGRRGESRFPARLVLESQIIADESTKFGNVRAVVRAVRDSVSTVEPLFVVTLAQEADPTKGIDLRPFDFAAMRRVLDRLAVPPKRPPEGIRYPGYDRILGTSGRLLAVGSDFLRVLEVEGASLTFKMDLDEQNLVNDLIAPIFGKTLSDGKTQLDIGVFFRGADETNEVNALLTMRDIKFPELPSPLRVSAGGRFFQNGQTITAMDLKAGIAIDRGEDISGPVPKYDLELGLSNGGPDGELGPPRATYINLANGVGHFELQLESLSREMIEVLLQVQTFNLSETLAQPLYERILDLLGMTPGNTGSVAKARTYLVGDLGETHTIHSVIQISDLAPGRFLRLPKGRSELAEQRIDVRWEQTFSLRRVANEVAAAFFDLRILSKEKVDLATLSLEGELPAVFDLPTIEAGGAKQLEALALSDGPADEFRELLKPVLDSLSLARESSRSAGSRLVFDVPNVDLAAWSSTLIEAGIPIYGGAVRMHAEAELASATAREDLSSLSGEFEATNLMFGSKFAPLPQLIGQITVAQTGEIFELRNLETRAQLDPALPPARIVLSGTANPVTGAATTKLRLDGLNAAVVDRLVEVEASGIGNVATIAEYIPLSQLRDIAGRDTNLAFEFEADTPNAGQVTRLRAKQFGENVNLLPRYLAPLSFSIEQSGEVDTSGTLTVNQLSGVLREHGVETPLLELNQSAPFKVGKRLANTGAPDAEIRLKGRKNLSEFSEALRGALMPFVRRSVDSGEAELDVRVIIPEGRLHTSLQEAEIKNTIHAGVRNLRLSGFDSPIHLMLDGAIVKSGSHVRADDWLFETSVSGAPSGEITLRADVDITARTYDAEIDLRDWNRRLLDALPKQWIAWLGAEDPRLEAALKFNGSVDANQHDTTVSARLRNLPVPPLTIPGRTEVWQHPPLEAQLDIAATYDADTTTVLARTFKASLTSAPANGQGGAGAKSTLASLELKGPARVPLTDANGLSAPGRAELEFVSGPLDAARYAPVLSAFTGVPLEAGTVRANAVVIASGSPDHWDAEVDANASLKDGAWVFKSGQRRALEAQLVGRASAQLGAVDLKGLTLKLIYPRDEDTEDDLTFTGSYTDRDGRRNAQLAIVSDGIAIDRVLELASSMREPAFAKPTEPKVDAGTGETSGIVEMRMPRDLTAELTLDAKELRFRKLVLPNTSVLAKLKNGIASIERFRVDATKGSIELGGHADLAAKVPTYSGNLTIRQLAATPWVASFAPAFAERFTGDLDADATMQGAGVTPEELAANLGAKLTARVSNGRIEDTPLKSILGDLGKVEARLEGLLTHDRLIFTADTPRDDTKDIRVSGYLRNAVPRPGVVSWVEAVADVALTKARKGAKPETRDGLELPPRKRGLGARIRLSGPLGANQSPETMIETIYN
jgi:hypothetical protein